MHSFALERIWHLLTWNSTETLYNRFCSKAASGERSLMIETKAF